jgi:hypothetical protein
MQSVASQDHRPGTIAGVCVARFRVHNPIALRQFAVESQGATTMAEKWLLRRGDQEIGPMRSGVFKHLAVNGQLRPDDLVRKTSMNRFVPASAVKGLFPSDAGHRAPVVAEKAPPAPHDEKKPEFEVPGAPVAATGRPVPWTRIGIRSLVGAGGVVALVSLIFLASALGHRGVLEPGTGVVAGVPAESAPPTIAPPTSALPAIAPPAIAVAASQPGEAAPQDELSDELRALPPDKAIALAIEYLQPPETEARKRTAFLLLQDAANAGDGRAMLGLSDCYRSGIGTPASRADWMEWLRKSAEAGQPDGMYEFSVAIRRGYFDGLGEADGRAWLRRSAEAGHEPAVDELKRIQAQDAKSFLERLFSRRGSNNDDSDEEGPACAWGGALAKCYCGGFEPSHGRMPGGRETDYNACKLCEHDKSDHRR